MANESSLMDEIAIRKLDEWDGIILITGIEILDLKYKMSHGKFLQDISCVII